jgi:hypothetical protein
MDRFLQAYCVPFLDAGAGIYEAPRDELSRKVDEFIKLLRIGMGGEWSVSPGESTGQEYVRTTVF